jgi:hypothetical protein
VVDVLVTAGAFYRRRLRKMKRVAASKELRAISQRASLDVSEAARPLVEELLREPNWSVLRDLSDRIVASGDSSVITPLTDVLVASRGTPARSRRASHPTPLQYFVVRILKQMGRGRIKLSELARGLDSVDIVTRELVAELLAEFPDERASGALIGAMFREDSTAQIVRTTAMALGRIGGKKPLEALRRYASSGRWSVCALKGLSSYVESQPLSPEHMRGIAETVVATLESHGGVRERECAAQTLGAMEESIVGYLEAAVAKHPEPHSAVMEAAVDAIGRIGGVTATAALGRIAEDDEQNRRFRAVRALAFLKTQEAHDALTRYRPRSHDTAVNLAVSDALEGLESQPQA